MKRWSLRPAPGSPPCPAVGGGDVARLPICRATWCFWGALGLRLLLHRSSESERYETWSPITEWICRRSRILAFVRCQVIRKRFPSHLVQQRDKYWAAAFLPRQAGSCSFICSKGLGLLTVEILEYHGHKPHPQRFLGLLMGSCSERAGERGLPDAPWSTVLFRKVDW